MYSNIFSSLFWNIRRLKKLNIPRYSWTIEMKVLELNCEIDEFINKILKKKADDKFIEDLKKSKDISKNLR